ncbi:MAG: hypothetical protein LBK82_09800, partial [Planctomycetaceae bacterium]|nr:hypothetical protein [Planctomycetaceae bacterium]
MKRRSFLQTVAFGTAGILAASSLQSQEKADKTRLHVAVNQYTANNLYQRDNKNFLEHLDELKSIGADGLEP